MDGKSGDLTVSELAHSIETVRRAFTRENLDGLEALAAQTLVLIAAEPGLSLKQCAQRLSAGQSNVSTAVSRLVNEGLVNRNPSKADPRTHDLRPTAQGKIRARVFATAASME